MSDNLKVEHNNDKREDKSNSLGIPSAEFVVSLALIFNLFIYNKDLNNSSNVYK
jgi:hypothetical protein